MLRLLVDEDLPRSLAPALRAAGHDAADVRDDAAIGILATQLTNLLEAKKEE